MLLYWVSVGSEFRWMGVKSGCAETVLVAVLRQRYEVPVAVEPRKTCADWSVAKPTLAFSTLNWPPELSVQ